ncbi:CinA family protein [Cellulosimicrobium arenosum]|uniref:CinA family protein n=1 Tax=Cellulosimicrobium arenosum TaxID=2708133 RepID=A0A927G990_9MICO|nr:CinA family protein [Cellulosimicrobium arenosum]
MLALLRERGWTLGVAESLTGGLVTATIVDVPGASVVLRGGIVAYATDTKAAVLGVDAALLAARGAVDPDVACSMADAARRLLRADVGLATTGVAGPDPQDGRPPGLVYVAVSLLGARHVRELELLGDRAQVRAGAVHAGLRLLVEAMGATDSVPADAEDRRPLG